MPATLIYSPLIPTSYALVGGFAARYVRRGMRRTPPAVYGNGISLSGERYLHRNAQLFPVNPLTGIWVTHHTALGYRHASPDEESLPLPIEGNHSEVHQQTANYSLLTANWTFTFSAKERDSETGLSYFGSRYYSSDLSIWLSVDPMSGKYPSLSPYTYCADNPVKLVDPNGEEIGDYFSMSGRNLGSDGKNDDKIYFVSNKADKRKYYE